MSMHGNETEAQSSDDPENFEGECKKCPETVSGATAGEATAAAMDHAGDAHGDRLLGFRWK